jgi:glycerate kinase
MDILVAIDSFKGTISSVELTTIITDHLSKQGHRVINHPISDGGEGFIDSLALHYKKNFETFHGVGPLMDALDVSYLTMNDTAYLELSQTAGITLIPKSAYNPLKTSTYGLGLLIKEVIVKGYKNIVVGLGGSATNDGGAGMLQAMGAQFYHQGSLILSPMNGETLGMVESIDLSQLAILTKDVTFVIASDVKNLLLGQFGASHVFAKQKGATSDDVIKLESNVNHYAKLIEESTKKISHNTPGSGAAGGVGFAFLCCLNAKLYSGIDVIMDLLGLDDAIKSSDLVIVGEGKLDEQTMFGKAPYGIAMRAKKYHKKVIGLFGQAHENLIYDFMDSMHTIVPKYASLCDALEHPKETFINMLKDVKIS